MCCRSHCGCTCGCGSATSAGCGCGSGNNSNSNGTGCGGHRPTCGWAYICQYPGHRPMPLAESASTLFEETSGCGCGCG